MTDENKTDVIISRILARGFSIRIFQGNEIEVFDENSDYKMGVRFLEGGFSDALSVADHWTKEFREKSAA